MNTIISIILYILAILLVSALFGWLIAKWKMKRYLKRMDITLTLPEIVKSYEKQKAEQDQATVEREVNQNERRRAVFRSYGDRNLIPIDLGAGKPEFKGTAGRDIVKGANERQDSIQNTDSSQTREPTPGTEGTNSTPEEDWPSFS